MVGIGIRVYSNTKIFYTIIEETDEEYLYLAESCLNLPLSLIKPERFNYLRNTLLDIIAEYKVTKAGIKVTEHTAIAFSGLTSEVIERFYIEGVIQEALAGSEVDNYIAGRIDKFAYILEMDRSYFKDVCSGTKEFESIPEHTIWKKLKNEERDSILAAHVALNLK